MNAPARFAGWIAGADEAPAARTLVRMLDAPGPSAVRCVQGPGWALGVTGAVPEPVLETPASGGALLLCGTPRPAHDDDGPCRAALGSTARLDPQALAGSFLVLRVYPGQAPRLEAVSDRFGSFPLYHARVPDGVAFASTPLAVARHPAVAAHVDPQAIYEFLYSGTIPLAGTIFDTVQGLLPGSVLEADPRGVTTRTWWRPAFHPQPPATGRKRQELGHELRAHLLDSVARHAGPDTGCFLSGGMDSSSIVGMLREATGEAPATFSVGFATDDYDELDYARLVARHFGTRHHEYMVTPEDIMALFPELTRTYGQPFGNSSAIPTFHCAAFARREGMRLLLAGDGGDELFGGNKRYAEQLVFGLYGRMPRWVRAGLLEPLLPVADALRGIALSRKGASYVRQASVPLPDRLERYNYLHRIGTERILTPSFLAQVDVQRPLALRREVFAGVDADDDVNRMLGLDFKFTLTDSDLPKVRGMCAAAGVDVRFPFLEPALVDFAAALSVADKVTPRKLRVFFKEATTGFLPDAVITKKKHGFGLPFGIWLTTHDGLREWAWALLDRLAGRDIVDAGYVAALKGRLLPELPRYYGPLVWSLVALEGWLEEHDEFVD